MTFLEWLGVGVACMFALCLVVALSVPSGPPDNIGDLDDVPTSRKGGAK